MDSIEFDEDTKTQESQMIKILGSILKNFIHSLDNRHNVTESDLKQRALFQMCVVSMDYCLLKAIIDCF